MTETRKTALMFIACIRAALINGAKHYNSEGKLLETEIDILNALLIENSMTVDEKFVIRITTAEEQLEIAKKEFTGLI